MCINQDWRWGLGSNSVGGALVNIWNIIYSGGGGDNGGRLQWCIMCFVFSEQYISKILPTSVYGIYFNHYNLQCRSEGGIVTPFIRQRAFFFSLFQRFWPAYICTGKKKIMLLITERDVMCFLWTRNARRAACRRVTQTLNKLFCLHSDSSEVSWRASVVFFFCFFFSSTRWCHLLFSMVHICLRVASLVPTCDWVSYWPVKEARKSPRWCSRIPVLHWRTPLAFSELFSWSWPRRCSWLGSSSLFETPFTSTQPPWDLLRLRPCPLSLLTQDTC